MRISFDNAGAALGDPPAQNPVDLSELVDADSATLAVLIAWSAQARARGIALRYLNAPPALRNLAHLSDVDGMLGL
ncbi:MAG: STAS domain-containing protein [Proteobacteria bacterium]|uniref:STAS domain-containing protein n=1 Tax=Rudaea sp. TaxID=2136325 RepID=UPI0032202E27|nr:STAS domain-containing protein [Pseudomonadota bacterium]